MLAGNRQKAEPGAGLHKRFDACLKAQIFVKPGGLQGVANCEGQLCRSLEIAAVRPIAIGADGIDEIVAGGSQTVRVARAAGKNRAGSLACGGYAGTKRTNCKLISVDAKVHWLSLLFVVAACAMNRFSSGRNRGLAS